MNSKTQAAQGQCEEFRPCEVAKLGKAWDYPRMTVIADDKGRVQLRRWQVQPGDVWAVEAQSSRKLVLTKLERPEPKLSLLEHLRGLSGLELPKRAIHCPPRV